MDNKDEFLISEEEASWIDLKKSESLSKLIEKQLPDDIGFESYEQYQSLITSTLEGPDTVWELWEDQYLLRTYIKTYSGEPPFHQVILGVVLKDKKKESELFVPILMFVTKYSSLVQDFSKGDKTISSYLN